jgi:hypothetical protein
LGDTAGIYAIYAIKAAEFFSRCGTTLWNNPQETQTTRKCPIDPINPMNWRGGKGNHARMGGALARFREWKSAWEEIEAGGAMRHVSGSRRVSTGVLGEALTSRAATGGSPEQTILPSGRFAVMDR